MIIDSHCHFSEFGDLRETLRTALAHGVWGVVAVGCDAETNARTLAAAAAAPKSVWACLGFHPDWTQLTDEDLDLVAAQIAVHHSRIVGLGEVGLPWYSLEGRADAAALMARGRARLDRLLRLASRWDLPVALHAPHGAAVGALGALRAHGIERAVFHWHKAPADVTQAIVDAGLVESDGPWQYDGEFEGLPSGPWFASRVAEEIAKLKQLPADDVIHQLSTNACRLFDLVWA